MLYIQLLKESSGSELKLFYTNSQTVYETNAIDTSRANEQAILLIHTETIGAVTRQVSVNGTNFYNVFDTLGGNLTAMAGTFGNSRMLIIDQNGTNKVIAPWTKFRFMGVGTGSYITMWYLHTEE